MIYDIEVCTEVFNALKAGGDIFFIGPHQVSHKHVKAGDKIRLYHLDDCTACERSGWARSGCQHCGAPQKRESCRTCGGRGATRNDEILERTVQSVVTDADPLGRGLGHNFCVRLTPIALETMTEEPAGGVSVAR